MNILRKLTIKDLKLNKKRTIGTIIGIVLSCALIVVVLGMAVTAVNSILQAQINNNGYYHLRVNNINEEDINYFKNSESIKDVIVVNNVGSTYYDKENNYTGLIYSMDKESFDDLSYHIIDGEFPKNEKELLINRTFQYYYDLNVGDYFEMEVGEINKDKNGKINNSSIIKYKISGIIDRYGDLITTNTKSSSYNVYLILKNPNDYKSNIPKLLGVTSLKDFEVNKEMKYKDFYVNFEILLYETMDFSSQVLSVLATIIGIVLFVIIVTSVFSIRNSFAISITEKLKTYGMLSSIGATKKQIRKMVLFEGFVLGLIGISIGILLGIGVNILLVFIINTIGENANLFGDGFSIVYKFSMFPIILSIILSCVVIIISSLFCSYKASCVSPIQNIRNSDDIKSKKLRTPKFIRKLFGIGGVLSYKNLKRSKKKYRVTIISLTISIFIYIIVSTFVEYTLNIIHEEYSTLNYNIQVSLSAKDYDNTKELQNDMIKKLETLDKAYTRYYMYFQDGDIDFENHITSSSIKYADDFVLYEMVLYNDNGFKEYLERLDLDYDEMKNKVIIINEIKDEFASKRNEYITLTDYKKGDLLTYKDKSVEVGAVVRDKAIGLENNYSNTLYLIGNYEHFPLKEVGEIGFNYMYFNSKEPYKFVKTLKDLSTNELYIYVDNLEEQASQTRSIMLILSIIVYGFILVVTFIGVTSVFNTINSNMELRSKDFASLKSIGMTKKEFNNMINLEAIFYSLKSLFYGIIFGLIGSFVVYKLINKNYIFDYQIPIKSIIIAIIFIIILIIIIMRYSIKKINKQNIIETIRNSNI